jgi:hypothetical protein
MGAKIKDLGKGEATSRDRRDQSHRDYLQHFAARPNGDERYWQDQKHGEEEALAGMSSEVVAKEHVQARN